MAHWNLKITRAGLDACHRQTTLGVLSEEEKEIRMKTFEECQLDPVYYVIKQSTIETINNYVTKGLPPGGFVTAVLANDLMGALGRADLENRLTIWAICSYIHNEIGYSLHGSYKAVENHLKKVHEEISSD